MQTGWVKDAGTWYFMNTSGEMKTGWVKDGASWYFLNTSGEMKTGWVKDAGTWYYLANSGSMMVNTTVDGWKIDAGGAATEIITAVASVSAINATTVELTYREAVTDVKNTKYTIEGLTVSNAAVKQANNKIVVLTTSVKKQKNIQLK